MMADKQPRGRLFSVEVFLGFLVYVLFSISIIAVFGGVFSGLVYYSLSSDLLDSVFVEILGLAVAAIFYPFLKISRCIIR